MDTHKLLNFIRIYRQNLTLLLIFRFLFYVDAALSLYFSPGRPHNIPPTSSPPRHGVQLNPIRSSRNA